MPNAFFQGEKFFKGASPPPHPLGYGPMGYMCPITWSSVGCKTWKSVAVPRSNSLPNSCKAFAHFGQVYLMRLIFVKKLVCQIFLNGQRLIYVAGNCNENRKNFMSQRNLLSLQMNHKLEARFDLNLEPTTNYIYWRNFFIFLYFFVHLLKALLTIFFGKVLLFFIL